MDQLVIQGFGCTDIGHNRIVNEDYFNMNDFLFVLADGMGGHTAGDIASKLAVESIMSYINKIIEKKTLAQFDKTQVQYYVYQAFCKTNETVYNESIQHIEFKGMGTTLVLALFQPPQTLHIANIGDSRAYLLRNNTLKKITEDHSVTAKLLRNGMITKNEAETHPFRHHLSQYIGDSQNINPFIHFFDILVDDKILLCTDGLWNVLSEKEIIKIMEKTISQEKICKKLIKRAHELKSNDNVSCILIKITKK